MADSSFTAAFQRALDNITLDTSSTSVGGSQAGNLGAPSIPQATAGQSTLNQQAVASTGTQGAFAPDFGLPIGSVPGGNALDFLTQAGFPEAGLSLVEMLQGGQQLPAGNLGLASDAFGGLPIPSPQSIRNNPDFLASLFESVLGIPFDQIIQAALAPFLGLRQAPIAQSSRSNVQARR